MKKTIFSIAVLAILALNLSVSAMVKADFSGTWKLDTTKSAGLPPGMEQTMTVTQTGEAVKLETKVKVPQGEQTVPDSYTLDGKEADFTTPNSKGKRIAKRSADGNGIEVVEKADMQTQDGSTATVEITRKWSLSSDGKTLTIEMKVKTPQGEQQSKRIFVKQ
jgi:hypothetical protein